jgi:DNA-binding transcriptional MerR regulator
MKRLAVVGIFLAFGFTLTTLEESLRLLKITRTEAIGFIHTSISGRTPSWPVSASKIVDAKRIQIAKDLMTLAREYTKTPEFVAWYRGIREENKPPEPNIRHPKELQQEQIRKIESEIAQLRTTRSSLPEDQRSTIDTAIEQLNASIASMSAPDPNRDSAMSAAFGHMREEASADHERLVAVWNERYPENPNDFIKTQLKEYLDLVPTVDFTARTRTTSEGKRVFVEADHENMSYRWKLCYRIGKKTNDALTKIAKDWLRTLPQ